MAAELLLAPEILSSVERALAEDVGPGDATTEGIIPAGASLSGRIVSKESGVVAGLTVARAAFQLLDQQVAFAAFLADGDVVEAGQTVIEIRGSARAILTAERTALNFLGRMSGIATRTREFVEEIRGTNARILDTRKTAPNLRASDKLAVRLGGGENHRFGLYDMILIKDNHIDFAGSITAAVSRARASNSSLAIEVEARNLSDMAEALDAGVRWIMLDNMTLDDMRRAVVLNSGRAKLEASGNVSLKHVRQIAETGVDYISVGALTHSVQALDVSLTVSKRGTDFSL
ncbi:MAG TPA: carboxylating nicotinate-nucleotide diphosphorylase [Pyrinomonadaceae bacterium]|jgi:nicotinate-nucleotide pyrophosphorylase (carboxylating)|nr:carboxylating nicotinate-nucleotide diphosphorylase [Pyrinomonadaceae bacterium]